MTNIESNPEREIERREKGNECLYVCDRQHFSLKIHFQNNFRLALGMVVRSWRSPFRAVFMGFLTSYFIKRFFCKRADS